MLLHIAFDLVPVAFVISYLFTVSADRKHPLQRFYVSQCHLDLVDKTFPLSFNILGGVTSRTSAWVISLPSTSSLLSMTSAGEGSTVFFSVCPLEKGSLLMLLQYIPKKLLGIFAVRLFEGDN